MATVAHFLLQHGAAAALNFAVVGLLGWLVKLGRQHLRHQRRIADLLDTSTPGGLADVIAATYRKGGIARRPGNE